MTLHDHPWSQPLPKQDFNLYSTYFNLQREEQNTERSKRRSMSWQALCPHMSWHILTSWSWMIMDQLSIFERSGVSSYQRVFDKAGGSGWQDLLSSASLGPSTPWLCEQSTLEANLRERKPQTYQENILWSYIIIYNIIHLLHLTNS